MYDWTQWLDHVLTNGNYNLTQNKDGTYTITPAGTVMQQGTSQDQVHFNNIEDGIVDAYLAVALVMNALRQDKITLEKGVVTLTNNEAFPFNNSQATIALSAYRDSTDYVVICECTGVNIGDVIVSDKLINGFKLAYTGSAASATINYTIIGGYLK